MHGLTHCTRILRNLRIENSLARYFSVEIPASFSKKHAFSKYKKNLSNTDQNQQVFEEFEDSESEKSLVFNHSPDKFGTLSSNRMMRQFVETGIEDEEDISEINYVDGIEGKRRLKPINYAMKIKMFLNENKLADALAVLENTMLREHKAKPDLYIYNLLISGCAKHGYTKKAFQLFNQMKKRAIVPRLSTYTSLFNACALGPWDYDSLDRARHLKELMFEKNIEPNTANYNAMIKAFGRHGDLETSFSLMDEMISKNIPINSTTYNFLLQAAVSDKKAGFRHSIIVWKKMLEKKIMPSIHTFNIILRSIRDCGTGDMDSTQELFKLLTSDRQKMIESGGKPENNSLRIQEPTNDIPASYVGPIISVKSNLVKPWDRLMLLGNVSGFLSMMDAFKIKPDIKTFSLLLGIIPPSDELEQGLIDEMEKRNVPIDTDFCNMLIKKRNCNMRFSSALKVLDIIREKKLPIDIVTFGVCALGCNNLKTAKQLLKNIEDFGYRVNIEILTAMLSHTRTSLDIDIVLLVIKNLLSENIVPDTKFYGKLTQFVETVEKNLQLKRFNKIHLFAVDSEDFNKKYSKLLTLMDDIKNKINDPSSVHPWEQFKTPYHSQS